jgi:hypothetical protein
MTKHRAPTSSSFGDFVAAHPKREPLGPPEDDLFFSGPPLNRVSFEGDLWDRSGVLYEKVEALDRKVAWKLVRKQAVQMGLTHCGSGVIRWFDSTEERTRAWEEQLSPNLIDQDDWRPPADAPGAQPFVPELWREVGGRKELLLFSDG